MHHAFSRVVAAIVTTLGIVASCPVFAAGEEGEGPSVVLAPQSIIDFSKQYLGVPYRRGAKGPTSFDCSGFTAFVFKQFGYTLHASAATQITQGSRVVTEELRAGDLVFFKGRNRQLNRVGHVGIIVANDGAGNISFIHASRGKGITIDRLYDGAYYQARYLEGRRVIDGAVVWIAADEALRPIAPPDNIQIRIESPLTLREEAEIIFSYKKSSTRR